MNKADTRRPNTGFLPVLPPRFALVELAIFAFIIGCEHWIPAFPDLTKLSPHPYWVAVLLLSLQYGTVSGLLAAAMAIAGTLLIGLPEAEIGESYFSYLVRIWTQPVLWITVALVLGSFRMRQIDERHSLIQQADDATVQAALLATHTEKLQTRVDVLERRFSAIQHVPQSNALHALVTLQHDPRPEERLQAVRGLMSEIAPGAAWSVFGATTQGLMCVCAEGWGSDTRWSRSFAVETPLAHAILEDARTLSVSSSRDEATLAGQGQIALPIVSTKKGAVVGMLKVEKVATSLEPALLHRLSVLAPHLATLAEQGETAGYATPRVVPLVRRMLSPLAEGTEAAQGNTPSSATTRPFIDQG